MPFEKVPEQGCIGCIEHLGSLSKMKFSHVNSHKKPCSLLGCRPSLVGWRPSLLETKKKKGTSHACSWAMSRVPHKSTGPPVKRSRSPGECATLPGRGVRTDALEHFDGDADVGVDGLLDRIWDEQNCMCVAVRVQVPPFRRVERR